MAHGTLASMFWNRVERDGDRAAQRYKANGTWHTLNWRQVGEVVRELATGLLVLGRRKEDAVGILSASRAEWVQADFAIFSAGCRTIPIYPTYPPDLIQYLVNDAGVKTLFVEDAGQLAKVLEVQGKLDGLEQIVVMQGYEGEASPRIMTWDELRRRGRDNVERLKSARAWCRRTAITWAPWSRRPGWRRSRPGRPTCCSCRWPTRSRGSSRSWASIAASSPPSPRISTSCATTCPR